MALKNLFDMVKADRYTADGREELIKAQEAETEDATRRTYQIGEISQSTGLQKTANGWVKPKSGKQPGAKKQEKKGAGIPQATTESFVGKTYKDFVESATPSGYKPTKNTDNPDGSSTTVFEKEGKQIKVDFDKNGKITKVSPGEEPGPDRDDSPEREAYERELSRQQAQRAADDPRGFGYEEPPMEPAAPVKRNEAETVKHSDGTESYRIKGTQFYFNTPEEAENAILAKNRGEATYARPSQDSTVNNIQESLGFKLDTPYGGKHSMDDFMKKTGENEYAVNVWSFGTDSKGTLINPLSESDKPNATIKKENGEWKLHYKNRDGKEIVVTANGRQDPTRDAAPTLSEIVDRVYNIGEISEKTGLQKTANGWVKPKKGAAPAKKENPTRTFEFKAGPDGNPVAGSGKEVKTYKTKKEAQEALKKQKAAGDPDAANKAMETKEHVKYLEQDLKQAQRTKAGPDKEFNIKYKILETLAGGTDAAFESFKEAKKTTASREEALEQALNKYNYSTKGKDKEKKPDEKQPAGTRHAEKRKTNRPKAIRWDRNNLNEMRGNEEYINAKAADNYYHQYGLDKIGEWKDRKGWTVKEYQNDDGETYRAKYNGEKYVGSEYDPTGVILSPENKDAAPRVLTGDTKIRIRKA